MNVLSLFDGMSCGQLALQKAGIKVDKYFASEIKPLGIKVTQENFPNTIQLGSVTELEGKDLPKIDLLIGGSPCQNLSIAMAEEHRKGLEGDKSSLFYEYYRIFKETKPTYFFLENVGSMPKKDEDIITELMGVEPIRINSKLISPQLRNRLYWTNIPGIEIPKEKDIQLNNILTEGWSDRKKARCLLESDSRPVITPIKRFHRYLMGFITLVFKDEEHYYACKEFHEKHFHKLTAKQIDEKLATEDIDISVYDGIRVLNQQELEICQTVPEGYTKSLTRNEAAGLLGDGWTVDVIAHMFSFIPTEQELQKEEELDDFWLT